MQVRDVSCTEEDGASPQEGLAPSGGKEATTQGEIVALVANYAAAGVAVMSSDRS